jgi:transcriptional regulator with XRE-family HTH domain
MIFLMSGRLIPMNLLSFSERLEYAMNQAGVRPVDLANHLKTSRPAISYLLNGQSKGMRPEHLTKAAKWLQVRVEWLATGEEPMRPRQLSAQQRALLDYSDHVSPETLSAVLRLMEDASAAYRVSPPPNISNLNLPV